MAGLDSIKHLRGDDLIAAYKRTSGTLPNRSKTRSYAVRGHLVFWSEGVRLHGENCA
jgi:hypothetical protein